MRAHAKTMTERYNVVIHMLLSAARGHRLSHISDRMSLSEIDKYTDTNVTVFAFYSRCDSECVPF